MSNSGNLHKSNMATGQILKGPLQPFVFALCVISLLGVFGYAEAIYDVTCSVQGQNQMFKVG